MDEGVTEILEKRDYSVYLLAKKGISFELFSSEFFKLSFKALKIIYPNHPQKYLQEQFFIVKNKLRNIFK